MNPLIQLKQTTSVFLVAFGLACFGLSPAVQAVTPVPDGGYSGGNTAEGSNALFSLTSGIKNTANGYLALFFDTTGHYNTAIGAQALHGNTTGVANTANEMAALFHNTSGGNNTATGFGALFSNTTGSGQTAYGYQAAYNTVDPVGGRLTAIGIQACFSNTTGYGLTAVGNQALYRNTTGFGNVAVGYQTLYSNTTGSQNDAHGSLALYSNTTGNQNAAMSHFALESNTTGRRNVAIGFQALDGNITGNDNTADGFQAGFNQTFGSNNVYIGAGMVGVAGESNSCYIASIDGQTSASGVAVLINSSGKLGTTTSSRRFKESIKPMDNASEALFALKPVTFRYKKKLDPQGIQQWGLVAEDVQRVNPALVALDKEGRPYAVRYEAVNAMLLNEFLKEHRKVEQLEARLVQQEKDFAAHLKEQASQIQKMSAQLEASKPAPQLVNNP